MHRCRRETAPRLAPLTRSVDGDEPIEAGRVSGDPRGQVEILQGQRRACSEPRGQSPAIIGGERVEEGQTDQLGGAIGVVAALEEVLDQPEGPLQDGARRFECHQPLGHEVGQAHQYQRSSGIVVAPCHQVEVARSELGEAGDQGIDEGPEVRRGECREGGQRELRRGGELRPHEMPVSRCTANPDEAKGAVCEGTQGWGTGQGSAGSSPGPAGRAVQTFA